MPARLSGIQHAAQHKIRGRAVVDDEDHRNEGKRRTADGVNQVFTTCTNALRILLMRDQWQGDQRQAFVEHIQREQIACHGYGQRDAVGHGVEGEEGVGPFLMAHVFKAIQRGKGP